MVSLAVAVRPHRRERMAVLLPHRSLQVIKTVRNSELFEGAGDRAAAQSGEELVPQFLISGGRRGGRRGGEACGSPGEKSLSPSSPGPPVERAHTAGSPHSEAAAALRLLAVAAAL